MTTPPLPASPCVRVSLKYSDGGGQFAGSRFFLSYSGSAPTGANCTTLAGDIEAQWASHIAPLCSAGNYDLVEVDVLDIATNSGLSGQWSGSTASTRSGSNLPLQCATNVEYDIARRYRGGKPRMYLPPGYESDMAGQNAWNATFITAVNTGVAAFFAGIAGLSVGSMGTLAHVSLSYYRSFTNIANSSGRERAVPTYKATATLDTVNGYSTKATIGSQKRRRTATTA